ncbi:MAG: FecCD family ABC transporter permease, partial [Myxococcota bacterium]
MSGARGLLLLTLGVGLALAFGLALGSAEHTTRSILIDIRLPRVLLGAFVGAGLATAGALLQALLRNPLADPYILGISGGAALGGVLALAFAGGLGLGGPIVPVAAFGGALAATALLHAIAGREGMPRHSLLLTGVVFNAFAGSLIVFLTAAVDLSRVAGIFLWLIGSIRPTSLPVLGAVALLLGAGIGIGLRDAYSLNLLSLGDESAAQLGVEVQRVRRRILFGTSLMIGAAVAVSGLVGFVGLIVPHLLRGAGGADHRWLVPASALGGAAFVVVADTLARTLLSPAEL